MTDDKTNRAINDAFRAVANRGAGVMVAPISDAHRRMGDLLRAAAGMEISEETAARLAAQAEQEQAEEQDEEQEAPRRGVKSNAGAGTAAPPVVREDANAWLRKMAGFGG